MNVRGFGLYLAGVGVTIAAVAFIMAADPSNKGEVAELGWWFIGGLAGTAAVVGFGLFQTSRN